ncbi:MAG TPA: ABC transporter permease [Gemmatimonadaceae bacterium]|jgi:predicted permease|nr:ABC transporter permease [Gemmatimonadaceae bacterium]
MANLRVALRTLFKTPFVTAVAVLSLALGIGANAAIFSLFNQMLLRPLPVPEPHRLVNLAGSFPNPGSQSCSIAGNCDVVFSYPMFRDLEKAQTVFTGIAAHRGFGANLSFRKQTLNTRAIFVSGSYFPVLELKPALGRLFGASDDLGVGASPIAVLAYSYWETRLASDPTVIGQPIVINGQAFTIIGVAPKNFDGTTLGERPSIYVPISMRGALEPGFNGFDRRSWYWVYLFARLKPGVSMEQAKRGIDAIYRPIINDVEAKQQQGLSDKTMERFRAKVVGVSDGARGQSSLHDTVRTPLYLLIGITAIVLIIACANIANLLLARAANRSMEMAVRLSLGASRRQLLTQLLTESCVLAVLGGIVSLVVARWTLAGLGAMLPPDSLGGVQFAVDPTVVAFAAGLSILTGVVFGLFPALHATRADLVTTLRANSGKHSSTRSAMQFRSSLVTAQIALSMALLIGAGLFVRSLFNVSRVNLGLSIENVVTFSISPERNGYTREQSRQFFQRAEESLQAIPGVTGVTETLVGLLAGNSWGNDVEVDGWKSGPDIDSNSRFNAVGAGYFKTLGVPVLSGREFTASDRLGTPKVAIVNEAFAKKFKLGRDVVGKHMAESHAKINDIEIVGLVKDAKYNSVKDDVPPVYFRPWAQDSTTGFLNFYVRTAMEPRQIMRTIPAIMAQIDPTLPVEDLKTLPRQVQENVYLDRVISTLSASFAALATLLAAIGLYGVLAYTVAQRTREIGVRMALGADAGRVRTMVLRQVGRMTLIGGVIGIIGSLAMEKTARSLLYGLEGHDPLVVIGSALVLALVALGAGYLPARRASKIHPMQALRYE